MIRRPGRLVGGLALAVVVLLGACGGPGEGAVPTPSNRGPDYAALDAAIERHLTTGSVSLDSVRAVVVSVDGSTQISHYRHGAAPGDTTHVWSVTKSVVSTLIGAAIADGLIGGLDQTLAELLPAHRRAMETQVAEVTLRQLMTMSGGFSGDPSQREVEDLYASRGDLVDLVLRTAQVTEPGQGFAYSNVSSHLVAAVLAAALERADGAEARSVLDYAREKLFDPLGIETRPAPEGLLIPDSPEFDAAGFAWSTDPRGIQLGAFGLRLRAADLVKLGEVYRTGGRWHDQQIVPAAWVAEATRPSELRAAYGLMWWLYEWGGHRVYAARGSEGHLVVVVPDLKAVIAVSSANHQQSVMDEEALFPLVNEVIMPALAGS